MTGESDDRQEDFAAQVEPFRRELLVHCYRMLGSLDEAEDLLQETLLRAWRARDSFQGRASLRTWLYKIATNVCLDALEKRSRRSLPQSRFPPSDPSEPFGPPIAEPVWLEPFPDEWLPDPRTNPEARYAAHESISLAFQVALQVLPARQRAVLVLRDVLSWRAGEVAELLETTTSAVNSMLHRARRSLDGHREVDRASEPPTGLDRQSQDLLEGYVEAWETANVDGLVRPARRGRRTHHAPDTVLVSRTRCRPSCALRYGVRGRRPGPLADQANERERPARAGLLPGRRCNRVVRGHRSPATHRGRVDNRSTGLGDQHLHGP